MLTIISEKFEQVAKNGYIEISHPDIPEGIIGKPPPTTCVVSILNGIADSDLKTGMEILIPYYRSVAADGKYYILEEDVLGVMN